MSRITILSKNLLRIRYEEAEELAEGIRALLPNTEVVVAGHNPEEGTYGIIYF